MARLNLPFRLPQLGPRTRKIVRYVALTFFALVVFVFALQMTFPYHRVRDKVIEGLSEKYEVQIGGVERGFMPGNVAFTAVTLRTRQTKPEETVTTFFIKRIEIKAGILSLLGGTISADLEAQIGAGTIEGTIEVAKFGKGSVHAAFVGRSLPGDLLPMRAALGLPMTGKIEFDVNLNLPVEKSKMGKTSINWQKVRGAISLACPSGCTFGDGKTKLKPLVKNTRNQAMVGDGIDFGKINLESLVAKASFKAGKLTVDRFDTKSKDGELKIDYTMTLEKEFGESMVAGCLRFKGSEDLLKREPKTFAALQTTGAELRDDGLFHIRLTDRFENMKRLNQECGPGTNKPGNGEDFDKKPERPGLTVQPDEPAKPTITAPQPTPTPTPMEAPPAADATGSADAPPPTPSPTPMPATPPGREPPRERPGEQGSAAGSASADGQVGAPPVTENATGSATPAMPPPE